MPSIYCKIAHCLLKGRGCVPNSKDPTRTHRLLVALFGRVMPLKLFGNGSVLRNAGLAHLTGLHAKLSRALHLLFSMFQISFTPSWKPGLEVISALTGLVCSCCRGVASPFGGVGLQAHALTPLQN